MQTEKWRPHLRVLVLGVGLLAGCSYPGPGNGYDYGMAASAAWVVSTGNNNVCRNRTWGASPDNFCADSNVLGCGRGINDGPTVVYDAGSDRFFYAAEAGGGLCVSAAPARDPLALDRAYFFTAAQMQQPNNLDQPHIAVSGNKIAVTINGSPTVNVNGQHSNTFVIRKQDVLDNVGAHTAVVVYAKIVTPSVIVGIGDSIAWVTSGEGSTKMTIGLITGVPGENGGIATTSATVKLRGNAAAAIDNNPYPGGQVLSDDHEWGGTLNAVLNYSAVDGELWTTTRVDSRKGGHQLEVDRVSGIAPTFNPSIGQQIMVPLPPGGVDFDCESLGVTPAGAALIGFTSSGPTLNLTPYLVLWRGNGPFTGPIPISPDNVYASTGLARLDFCPTGAAFPDGLRPGQWYAGVGLAADVAGAANNSFVDGRESVLIRDGLF